MNKDDDSFDKIMRGLHNDPSQALIALLLVMLGAVIIVGFLLLAGCQPKDSADNVLFARSYLLGTISSIDNCSAGKKYYDCDISISLTTVPKRIDMRLDLSEYGKHYTTVGDNFYIHSEFRKDERIDSWCINAVTIESCERSGREPLNDNDRRTENLLVTMYNLKPLK